MATQCPSSKTISLQFVSTPVPSLAVSFIHLDMSISSLSTVAVICLCHLSPDVCLSWWGLSSGGQGPELPCHPWILVLSLGSAHS